MSRVRVNYKSDLPPIGVTFMLGDHEVPVPTTDFVVRFFVEGSPGPSFECIHKGEEYINCEVTSEDTLTCYINNHELGCGRLCCEFIDLSRNVKYADGVQKTVTPTKLDVMLVDGAGDDLVEITESIAIDIETIIGEIREAMEVLDDYTDIIAALQAAVATIPGVIDDLETGGHTDALSAEQGKILKEIIDNLGRISVEGIKGFTPISSLNELPENPTTEQKRQAYLFENALYVYVGAGGDTLDGKYQSVDLVSLDWGDKSYNTSEFSGLGRRWLKKNMVEGVNVLTSAMIGTNNTEYFIQYDYDLDGATVTLPANANLVFMGGSIKNGTLIGNNTRIQAKKGVCIFDGITIQGTWDVAEAYSSWFKMHKKGYKIVDNSVTENAVTKYHGSDNVYHEFGTLTAKSDVYFVKSTLSSGAVKVDSVFVPFLTLAFYRGSDNEPHESSSLTSVSDVKFVKNTLGEGSNVVESSVFATDTTGTFYKGTDKNYYTIDEVILIDGVYYVESTLVDGEVGPKSIATTAVTMYLASNGSYYELSSLQSIDSTYFVESSLNSDSVKVDSVFAVGVYKGNNNQYYSLGRLRLIPSTKFLESSLEGGSVGYDSIFTVDEIYATFRTDVEGDVTDYVAAPAGVPGVFDGSSYAEYDDTAALQSLLDLRAKRAIIEDGTYMIKANSKTSQGQNVGLYYDLQNDNELVIDGWLKAIQNNLGSYHLLDVIDCNNIKITGKGGVEGDLAEHLIRGSSQYGMCLSVSGTNGLVVEGLTFAYAWGDCVYNHAWSHGRSSLGSGKTQSNHLYHNVKFLWGRRTGYVGERGNDVTIDSCYFYGCGKLRAVDFSGTYAAVDLEPPSGSDSLFAYVRGYTFKNNYFEHNRLGLRTERGINVSIYDNYFEDITSEAIYVVNHQYAREKDTTAPGGNKYTLPIMRIFNNNVRRAGIGISIAYNNVVNAEIYGNMLVSCNFPFYVGYGLVENCNIYNNSMYGCGSWYINTATFRNCDIYNNKSYGNGVAAGSDLIYIRDTTFPAKSTGTKIHDNYFSHDYNKSIYGLGEYGTESFYHGLFPYSNHGVATRNLLASTSVVEVYNNYVSDDMFLPWGSIANTMGINSVRTESSEVFLIGDTFKSSFGDEGTVTAGHIKSCSWITDEEAGATPFVANMDVELGQIVSIVESSTTYYKMCTQAGTCGNSLSKNDTTSGTAGFLNAPFTDSVIGTLAIDYKTRGTCTSSTRPTTFNFKGRRMFETDTCKELLYDGSDWVEITTN